MPPHKGRSGGAKYVPFHVVNNTAFRVSAVPALRAKGIPNRPPSQFLYRRVLLLLVVVAVLLLGLQGGAHRSER